MTRIAAQKRATPAQVALAWLLAQRPWIVPIPGTTKLHRLDENLAGATIELTADDLREIDDAAAKITVHAARYPLTCSSGSVVDCPGDARRIAARSMQNRHLPRGVPQRDR